MTAMTANQTLADLARNGPLPYERFLAIAEGIAAHIYELHTSGRVYGRLPIHSVSVGPDNEVMMPESSEQPEDIEAAKHEDLRQVGYLCAYLLTGGSIEGDSLRTAPIHPVISEAMPLDAWSMLLPPEAKLLVEQLVSPDPADRIQSAHELVVTLEEMQRLHNAPLEIDQEEEPLSWARLSVILPLAVVLVVVIWILVTVFAK